MAAHPCLALLLGFFVAATNAEDTFKVKFEIANLEGVKGKTGHFVVEVHPEWAPLGAARFREIIEENVWDKARFFRVVKGFVAQFGIDLSGAWQFRRLTDDPVRAANTRGRLTFASSGKDSRTTQVFINLADNSHLDRHNFAPFAEVVEGMAVVDALYSGYGEGTPQGKGPDQRKIMALGSEYLEKAFPLLSYIETVEFELDGQAFGDAARAEELADTANRALFPLMVVLPILFCALVMAVRVCREVWQKLDEEVKETELASKGTYTGPSPETVGKIGAQE